ncbi:tannase and feruloyl esterase-domain-containing protein [Aspergillus pseudoustus]|uniref:Carboxylic ester hydrolase n=1 Tax=Aspergillus pseudoustus TaxID=1810923 RepID=A0ABR4K7U2_9EURO
MDLLVRCSGLGISYPHIPGATVDYLHTMHVYDVSTYVPESAYIKHGPINVTDASFCLAWLLTDTWNERLMGLGGGGFHCRLYPQNMMAMLGAVAEGYAAVSTDCGHNMYPGRVGLHLLEDFASVSQHDAALIGKSVVKSFYGREPSYSYFSGCSQGGRQGMMLAQRYPTAYDGAVSSLAIYLPEILVMYPQSCELDYLTTMAARTCDDFDGVVDGIVTEIDSCNFNAFDMGGVHFPCGKSDRSFSKDGNNLWPGVDIVSNLMSILSSQCSSSGKCIGLPVAFSADWIRLAVKKNPEFDLESVTQEEFMRIRGASVRDYVSIIGSDDPDLTEFRDRGGKMLSFHGLAPGLGHCWSPLGFYAFTIFDDMVAWVERGQEPSYLPASFIDEDGTEHDGILCPYLERAVYKRFGDPLSRNSYFCAAGMLDLPDRDDL